MGIISTIGRRSLKVRCLIWSIYLVLGIGALTMIYPFWLMISGTGKNGVDVSEMSLIPEYLRDDTAYYRKALSSLFNESPVLAQQHYNFAITDFKFIDPPKQIHPKLISEWLEFLHKAELPFYAYTLGHTAALGGSQPENFRHFKNLLFERYDGDLSVMNKKMGTEFTSWSALYVAESPYVNRRDMPNLSILYNQEWNKCKEKAPFIHRIYLMAGAYFKGNYIFPQYTKEISFYNQSHNTNYKSYDEVRLTSSYPTHKTVQERRDWETFVREFLNIFWVKIDASAQPDFEKYLKAKYLNDIAKVNRAYKTTYQSFDQVKILNEIPEPYHGLRISDHIEFLKGWYNPHDIDPQTGNPRLMQAPIESIHVYGVDNMFRDFLRKRFANIAALNQATGCHFADFEQVDPPQYEYHYQSIMATKSAQRWEFATRNFKTVIDYIMLQGRGLLNTSIYCSLAVLCALIFNPLAAYALSRFQLPSTYKILLFLMLTMAFPQMVTQIPNFLMMREMGILNTFAALILPGLANGYSIFLLKGFFDSLPKELYESAMLDGASEVRIFWQITMSLSKPILAVIALNAFTASYSNFMMALLICQDQKMWTLMPWLYQLQQSSGPAIIYSSLIVASIPTFLIFMFCQNLIMRGIVVPVEK